MPKKFTNVYIFFTLFYLLISTSFGKQTDSHLLQDSDNLKLVGIQLIETQSIGTNQTAIACALSAKDFAAADLPTILTDHTESHFQNSTVPICDHQKSQQALSIISQIPNSGKTQTAWLPLLTQLTSRLMSTGAVQRAGVSSFNFLKKPMQAAGCALAGAGASIFVSGADDINRATGLYDIRADAGYMKGIVGTMTIGSGAFIKMGAVESTKLKPKYCLASATLGFGTVYFILENGEQGRLGSTSKKLSNRFAAKQGVANFDPSPIVNSDLAISP